MNGSLAVYHNDPTRGATLAELVVKYHLASNIITRCVYREIIEKRILRGECGRYD